MRQVQIFSAGLSPHLGEGEEKRLAPQDCARIELGDKENIERLGREEGRGIEKKVPKLGLDLSIEGE